MHAAAEHLGRYGGHRAAAGLSIAGEQLEAFRAAIEQHAAEVLTPELLQPLERVDAVVSGSELGLELAEELEGLEPCGAGNRGPRLLVPGARFGNLRAMGEGRHASFSVSSGGALARGVAFGCDGRLDVKVGEPADATFRLERNVWNGAVEPRLVLCHAQPCQPAPIEVIGEREDYLDAVWSELDRALPTPPSPDTTATRTILDRRGLSPLATLADAIATGDPVLAVCADVPRRLDGLRARVGGFALTSHHALECDPVLADTYVHLVVLDPPARPDGDALIKSGNGYAHWCWSDAELRFTQQMHELEYGLRASLAALYRGLRERSRVTGRGARAPASR